MQLAGGPGLSGCRLVPRRLLSARQPEDEIARARQPGVGGLLNLDVQTHTEAFPDALANCFSRELLLPKHNVTATQ